jgi:hypothetical protein
MDVEKSKKLQQYASILSEQAKDAEQSGKTEDATKHYLKLVDVFLVLASESQDHNMWQQYIGQAEAYQARIRSIVSSSSPSQATSTPQAGIPSKPANVPVSEKTDASLSSRRTDGPHTTPVPDVSISGTPKSSGTFSKILKPFQKSDTSMDQSQAPLTSSSGSATGSYPASSPTIGRVPLPRGAGGGLQSQVASSPPGQSGAKPPAEEKSPVPHDLYERSLSENKILMEKLQLVLKDRDEKVAFLESRNRELEERLATSVPRSEYDLLRSEYENMIPRQEYDRVRAELSDSVPISHYDLLLDRISNMVPREVYVAAERRALQLEDNLRHSVPSDVIEDLADEVSLLNIAVEVPPIVEGGRKKTQQEDDKKEENSESAESILVSTDEIRHDQAASN